MSAELGPPSNTYVNTTQESTRQGDAEKSDGLIPIYGQDKYKKIKKLNEGNQS
jgi:hypothetical protein